MLALVKPRRMPFSSRFERKRWFCNWMLTVSALIRRQLSSISTREAENTEGFYRGGPTAALQGSVPQDRTNDEHELQYAARSVLFK